MRNFSVGECFFYFLVIIGFFVCSIRNIIKGYKKQKMLEQKMIEETMEQVSIGGDFFYVEIKRTKFWPYFWQEVKDFFKRL